MKVDATSRNLVSLLANSSAQPQGGFQAALAEAQAAAAHDPHTLPISDTGKPIMPAKVSASSPQEALAEWLKKSPAEHMRDAILKQMGITEEELAQMPPEQRMAIEDTIAEMIKEKLLGQQQHGVSPYFNAQALLAQVAFARDTQKSALDRTQTLIDSTT